MALDGVFLSKIVKELKACFINSRIDKVNQPEKDEIIITFRSFNENKKLLISASANYPRIHITNHNKTNPLQPPMFCMLLRKYLIGSKVKDIEQIDNDRIIKISFEVQDELGFNSIYNLIIEIMGRHSNISLVRDRDHIIMDSIKHVSADMNSYRLLLPGVKYIYPPKSSKLNPFNNNFNDLLTLVREKDIKVDKFIFSNTYTGVSSLLSKDMFIRLSHEFNIGDITYEEIFNFANNFFLKLSEKETFLCYYHKDEIKEFYCIELKAFEEFEKSVFKDASSLLDEFYYKKDKQDRIYGRTADIHKILQNNIDRCLKKISILENSLEECKEKESYRIKGELLTANIYNVKKGMKSIEVQNYYSEKEQWITIELDENLTPSANIQYYYKKYTKFKKAEEVAFEQLENAREELHYLQSVLTSINNIDKYEEIQEIRSELIESGYIKHRKKEKSNNKSSKPLHFLSSEGADIYVGKNNMQNDFLTLKFGEKNDIWLHTKNIPGSHVIIKAKNYTEKTLEEAAILAAYYSKAQNSSKVPVDYTEIKNVKKPSGAKPGMVIYYTNRTILVTPYDLKLKKVE